VGRLEKKTSKLQPGGFPRGGGGEEQEKCPHVGKEQGVEKRGGGITQKEGYAVNKL